MSESYTELWLCHVGMHRRPYPVCIEWVLNLFEEGVMIQYSSVRVLILLKNFHFSIRPEFCMSL